MIGVKDIMTGEDDGYIPAYESGKREFTRHILMPYGRLHCSMTITAMIFDHD